MNGPPRRQRHRVLASALLLLVFGLMSAGCRTSSPPATLREMPVDLEMQKRGSEPAVEVFVNGQGPFLFAIDTGATDYARVDSSLAKRLNLQTTGIDIVNDGSGKNRVVNDTVNLKMLAIGGIEFHDVEATSRDFNRNPELPHIDGILTFDLFADYLMTLDYPGRRVRIELGELPAVDGAEILPLKRIHGLPAIDIEMADQHVLAEIDSGDVAAPFLVPDSLMKKLTLADAPVARGRGRTVSNDFAISSAHLDGVVRIGQHELIHPLIVFPAPFNFCNIGNPTLNDFAVTFDQKNARVRLRKK